jgi:hypothetical protein
LGVRRRPPLFVRALRAWLGCGGRSTGGAFSFFGDEAMVRGNRFGHSQAGRPMLRGGCIDRGGWVKKARTNKPKKECGGIWSTAPSAVFRSSAQSVAVSGGTSNRKSLFSSLVGNGIRVRGTGFGGWGSCAPHPKRWSHRTPNTSNPAPSAVFRSSARALPRSRRTFNRGRPSLSLAGGRRLCAWDRVGRLGVVRPAL